MSIRKKMIIFVLIIQIVPIFFILILSNSVLNNQIEKAAQGYLQNAFIIARNQMLNRLNEMQRLSNKTAKCLEFQKAIDNQNTVYLNNLIRDINDEYNYIDFYMFFNDQKKLILSKPDIKNSDFSRLNALIYEAKSTHSTVISEELLNLNDLFYSDSKEYNKFKVLININNKTSDTIKYLDKCLVAISVSPVYENNQIIGYFIIGAIANNNNYFPEIYSNSVENSYLAISVDGIRISSNIRSSKNENYIGSTIPIPVSTLEGTKDAYYGKVNIADEVHIFLDKPILDCDGNNVGVLGVGIPEKKFSIIMNTQRNIIILVTSFCLIFMIYIGIYTAHKIREPITIATQLVKQISMGNNEIAIDNRLLIEKNNETTMLLQAFKRMALDLKKSEKQRKDYLEKLKNEHLQQKKLSEKLVELNETLEEKVKIRTHDLREAVTSLKKAGEVKSLFLANMSHELRTPLSSIINCSEILKGEIFGILNDKQHKYMENILESARHLLALINDVLDISKIEAGKMTLCLGYYSILDIVNESFLLVKTIAYRKNLNVTIKLEPSDFRVNVDANKVKQILCNLLSNSIKFTNPNGNIALEVYKNGAYVELNVKDNGIGIKKDDQVRIFNEFEQVDCSYEREYEGTGLGLPLTKKLVEMHGGKIFLVSEFGKGTEVIVTLPIDIEHNTNNNYKIS
jgi:signal transduction histidine kinase